MALPAIRTLSLCTGYAGLDIGVHRASGGHARCVCYVEREVSAASVLARHMEEGRLDPAPIWSDLRSFDGRPWRGAVDLVVAGYPCQPESVAGRQRGAEDERWIWPDIARIIAEVDPALVFAENVAAHVTGTFARVLADLAALGLNAEWSCVSAAEVGAPHERDRLFWLVAHTDRVRQQGERFRWLLDRERVACGHDVVGRSDPRAPQASDADSTELRKQQGRGSRARRRGTVESGKHGKIRAPCDSQRKGLEGCTRAGNEGPRRTRAELATAGTWTWPPPEPAVPRMDDGPARGLVGAEIMLAGNGVVPVQAEYAFSGLVARMMARLS